MEHQTGHGSRCFNQDGVGRFDWNRRGAENLGDIETEGHDSQGY